MKMFAIVALTLFGMSAMAQTSNVEACGASRGSMQMFGPYKSDSGNGTRTELQAYRSDLRAVVIRSSKGTTRIQYLQAYDRNDRNWRVLIGSQIILSEDNEYMVCIPRRWEITNLELETSGGDKAKFRTYLFYR